MDGFETVRLGQRGRLRPEANDQLGFFDEHDPSRLPRDLDRPGRLFQGRPTPLAVFESITTENRGGEPMFTTGALEGFTPWHCQARKTRFAAGHGGCCPRGRMRKVMRRVVVASMLCVVGCGEGATSGASRPDPDVTADARGDGPVPNEAGVEGGAACPREDNYAEVTGGCIHGATAGSIHTFFGVPFAAPPTSERRWRAPADPIPWTGVREAVAFSKACPQIAALVTGKTLDWDEDCLYLNIWTPSLDANAKLPVMVWIHGGGLVNGSGVESIYSGKYISEKGRVVAVTINYRLGQLGYLGHPALAVEQNGRSGNYGLLDQI